MPGGMVCGRYRGGKEVQGEGGGRLHAVLLGGQEVRPAALFSLFFVLPD